ncbi:MAG TPA: DivIVA domain-containing protein [Acidimicrobiia bacterium]|nr:DivIVA domain-containing protein [Acidimicrobiia bacterium]
MTTEPTPDEIRRATFRVVFRGYDQAEVESRLGNLASVVEELTEQRDRLASRLGEFAERDLKSEFEVVGREVASVLEAARAAAETMRDRAGADAARWRSEAMAEVESMRKSARADAEALRTDAWTTSSQLLEQVMAEVERTRAASERDSLAVMGEAEREAHRLTSTARREAEEVVRAAKMEAERLVAQAEADHDNILATAHRQAEAAQERTRALEQRRQELMDELESLRATLASFESELEDRRQGIGLSEPMELPHRAVVSDEDGVHVADWEEGHTVRIIRPGRDEPPQDEPPDDDAVTPAEPEPTDAEALADEVARLRSEEERNGVRIVRPAPEETPTETAEEPAPEPEPEPAQEPTAAEEPVETPEPAPPGSETVRPEEPAPGSADAEEDGVEETAEAEDTVPVGGDTSHTGDSDDVLELFRRLRTPAEAAAESEARSDTEPAARPEPEPESPSEPLSPPESVPTPQPLVASTSEEAADPFETRDRLLLPITNDALRAIKRALTEAQNEALEQLRLGRWDVTGDQLEALVHEDLIALSEEAALAGAEAATELGVTGGTSQPPPVLPPPEMGQHLADAIQSALGSAGPGSRERQAAVSRVFRGWRTDEAERRLRHLALSSYHHSLRAVLDDHQRQWHWKAAGRLCATCRAASEAGHQLPPVHRDCQCTIVPD